MTESNAAKTRRWVWPQAALTSWAMIFLGFPAVVWIRGTDEPIFWKNIFIVAVIFAAFGAMVTQVLVSNLGTLEQTTPWERRLSALIVGALMYAAIYGISKYVSYGGFVESSGLVISATMGMGIGYAIFSTVIAMLRRKRH